MYQAGADTEPDIELTATASSAMAVDQSKLSLAILGYNTVLDDGRSQKQGMCVSVPKQHC